MKLVQFKILVMGVTLFQRIYSNNYYHNNCITLIFIKEIEPHSGELLCRQFDLNDGTSQSEEHITSLNENLLTITNRSKQRHEELVNEKERQKSRQCDRDRHRRSRDRSPRSSDEKSSSLEGNNSLHRTSDSSSITAPYADHRDSANYHRNYKDYQGNHHHQQQSFRLAYEIIVRIEKYDFLFSVFLFLFIDYNKHLCKIPALARLRNVFEIQ